MSKQNRRRQAKRRADWARKEARIRRLVRDGHYYLCSHIYDKIAINYWDLDDVVNSILTGFIESAENDEIGDAIDGKKYTINGVGCGGQAISTVGKLIHTDGDHVYLVITAY